MVDPLKPGSHIHVHTLAAPGEFGTMDRDHAWRALEIAIKAMGDKKYDNRVTARSLLTMAFYRPWTRLKKVNLPMLIVGATGDNVAPFASDKVRRVANPNLQVIEIDADHFAPYFNPVFPTMIDHQLTFLKAVVPR